MQWFQSYAPAARLFSNPQPIFPVPKSLLFIPRWQQLKTRIRPLRNALALQLHDLRCGDCHRIKAGTNPFLTRHLRHVQAHVSDFQHVVAAHALLRVHHAVVAKGDVDACARQR